MIEVNKSKESFNVKEAVKLRLDGLSYSEIGKFFNISRQAVHKRIKDLVPDQAKLFFMKNYKGDYLEAKLYDVIKAIDNEKLESASLNVLTDAVKRISEQVRLLRDENASKLSLYSKEEADKEDSEMKLLESKIKSLVGEISMLDQELSKADLEVCKTDKELCSSGKLTAMGDKGI